MTEFKQYPSWKRLSRKTIYNTPHLRVYEDTVILPGGTTIDDYSVVEFNDVIINIATDTDGNLIMLQEYRYAIDCTVWNVPAGSIRRGTEDIVAAARRELREETGYDGTDAALVGEVYDYPTKATHAVYIVRIKNAAPACEPAREPSELLRTVLLPPKEVKKLIFENQIKTTAVFSGIILALPELFGGDTQD